MGTTILYKLKDIEGNDYSWFASNSIFESSKTYIIKATVKAHNEYNGVKETQLTRAKIISEEVN